MADWSETDRIVMFWRTYERLSDVGACDAPGGMESRRVFEEWLDALMPTDIEGFIRHAANIVPGGA